eukprot:TRINITY_DN3895_c0_g4_i1.p1 TRINITY_DN3895_c0_g4~~TRINITY_DN3895_c0_g4_i1.p1  ORF type:complete len:664 (-),score=127.24 TRINITY_DN3895_c0_g4_i1:9-1763(-)
MASTSNIQEEVDAFFQLPVAQQRSHLEALISFRNDVQERLNAVPRIGETQPHTGKVRANTPPVLSARSQTSLSALSPRGSSSPSGGGSGGEVAGRKASDAAMYAAAAAAAAMQDQPRGTLCIKILAARNVKRKSASSEGIYCLVNLGKKYKKSTVVKTKGCPETVSITFDETLSFTKVKQKKELTVNIFEQLGFGRDRTIGTVVIPLSQLGQSGVDEKWCPIRVKGSGNVNGEIRLRTLFKPGDADGDIDESMKENPHRIFGMPLDDVLEREREEEVDDEDERVPFVVRECVRFLMENSLEEEGIFRVSGVQEAMISIQEKIDLGQAKSIDFSDESPHNVSGLLKLFLDSLPEPLLTFDLREKFLAISDLGTDMMKLTEIRKLVKELPQRNFVVLREVMGLLQNVAENASVNRMSADNLGIIFGMLLIRSPSGMQSADALSFASNAANVATLMILNARDLFFTKRSNFRSSQSFNEKATASPPSTVQAAGRFRARITPSPGASPNASPQGAPLAPPRKGMHRRSRSEGGPKGMMKKPVPAPLPSSPATASPSSPGTTSPSTPGAGREMFDPAARLKQLRPVQRS